MSDKGLSEDELNELVGKFAVDHSSFLRDWTVNNLPKNEVGGLPVLVSGLSLSIALFCNTTGKQFKLDPDLLKNAIMDCIDSQLDKYIVKEST